MRASSTHSFTIEPTIMAHMRNARRHSIAQISVCRCSLLRVLTQNAVLMNGAGAGTALNAFQFSIHIRWIYAGLIVLTKSRSFAFFSFGNFHFIQINQIQSPDILLPVFFFCDFLFTQMTNRNEWKNNINK